MAPTTRSSTSSHQVLLGQHSRQLADYALDCRNLSKVRVKPIVASVSTKHDSLRHTYAITACLYGPMARVVRSHDGGSQTLDMFMQQCFKPWTHCACSNNRDLLEDEEGSRMGPLFQCIAQPLACVFPIPSLCGAKWAFA